MKDNLVKENDFVLFYLSPRKKWLIQVSPGKQVHTHAGFIEAENVIGKEYGQSVLTNTNHEIYLLYPRLNDYIFKSKRATQILYPKDMAIIASWTDLSHGKKVVEAGSASVEDVSESADLINVFSMKMGAVSEKMEQDYERETGFVKIHLEEVIKRLDKKEELNEDELEERCQKGYKTHPTRKTKKMYGKTYRNCVKAE